MLNKNNIFTEEIEAIQKKINKRDPDLKITHTQLETRGSKLAATTHETSVFSKNQQNNLKLVACSGGCPYWNKV